jgi:hypothetical protein
MLTCGGGADQSWTGEDGFWFWPWQWQLVAQAEAEAPHAHAAGRADTTTISGRADVRDGMFVSLVYRAESTVRWFVVRNTAGWLLILLISPNEQGCFRDCLVSFR